MIDRFDILSSVVDLAATCLNDPPIDEPCAYKSFVGIGSPPDDCSFISASWDGDRVVSRRDRCHVVFESTLNVNMTKCCLKNVGEAFSTDLEEEDALCFYNDYDKLFQCMLCDLKPLLSQHGLSCDDEIVKAGLLPDIALGGCYGARIVASFRYLRKCC